MGKGYMASTEGVDGEAPRGRNPFSGYVAAALVRDSVLFSNQYSRHHNLQS